MEPAVTLQPLDGGDRLPEDTPHLYQTRPRGLAVHENCASTALALAAPVFGAGEVQLLAQDAQEAPLRGGVYRMPGAVDQKLFDRLHATLPSLRRGKDRGQAAGSGRASRERKGGRLALPTKGWLLT